MPRRGNPARHALFSERGGGSLQLQDGSGKIKRLFFVSDPLDDHLISLLRPIKTRKENIFFGGGKDGVEGYIFFFIPRKIFFSLLLSS